MTLPIALALYGVLVGATIIASEILIKKAQGTKGRRDDILVPMVAKLLYATLTTSLLLYVLHTFGVDVRGAIAGLGISGLLLAFAFQPSVKNFISGCMILIKAPYNPGQYIKVAGHEGIVEKMSFSSTTLKNGWGHKIVIPNSEINCQPIINCSATYYRPMSAELIFDPGTSADKVYQWCQYFETQMRERLSKKMEVGFKTTENLVLTYKYAYLRKFDENGYHVHASAMFNTYNKTHVNFRSVRQVFMICLAEYIEESKLTLGSGPLEVINYQG